MAVFKADESTVGHIPREVSKVAWYLLTHGGEIACEVTGRRRRSVAPGKGLEVPCIYTFLGKPKMIKKLVKLLHTKALANGFVGLWTLYTCVSSLA